MNDPLVSLVSSTGIAHYDSAVPVLFSAAGDRATYRFVEFFTANIHNPNTRAAYLAAVQRFSHWCEQRNVMLPQVNSVIIAKYIQELGEVVAAPTVKQHLASIRMLFDFLVTGHVVVINPAHAVRGPKYVVKTGKTPVLNKEETRSLLNSINIETIAGLRDRALVAVMVFSFARVSAVVKMHVEDYFPKGKRFWFRLHEKGGKYHEVPAHHKAEEYVDAYIEAAGIGGESKLPLFRTLDRNRQLTTRRMHRVDVFVMTRRRARHAGLPAIIGCHTFRATGITAYLSNGGSLEHAQRIAAHESPRTTKLYDRTTDEISLDEIERIRI
ncbi:MAG: tyrosine-type recombinase/integrase [Caldilineaceae bacterium]|nr:tyrosine-type recombinase/integrase [Caldilineaceae bacterium]